MPHSLWPISPVRPMLRGCQNGRAASGRGTDASDVPPPDRLPTWSIEVTPREQGLEGDSRLAEILFGAFEAIDDSDDL